MTDPLLIAGRRCPSLAGRQKPIDKGLMLKAPGEQTSYNWDDI